MPRCQHPTIPQKPNLRDGKARSRPRIEARVERAVGIQPRQAVEDQAERTAERTAGDNLSVRLKGEVIEKTIQTRVGKRGVTRAIGVHTNYPAAESAAHEHATVGLHAEGVNSGTAIVGGRRERFVKRAVTVESGQ